MPSSVKRAVVAGRRLARTVGERAAREPQPRAVSTAAGEVTDFQRIRIEGWVPAPADDVPVEVSLRLGDLEVMTTVAVAGGQGTADRAVFRFQTRGLWKFAGESDRVSVIVAGKALPIVDHGDSAPPPVVGTKTLAELRKHLAGEYVFSRWGDLQVVKSRDTDWQNAVLDLYDAVSAVLREDFGYDGFVIYGSLLGAIREGGVIGFDDDMDMAYVSRQSTREEIAKEVSTIALTLIERGFQVTLVDTNMYVRNPKNPKIRIDLFHLYFDESDVLCFPFGVAGPRDVTRDAWRGVRTATFGHRSVDVPEIAEDVVAAMYGEDWRVPNRGFNWKKDRRTAGYEGRVPDPVRSVVNWEDHHNRIEFAEPSTFAADLLQRTDLPGAVLDLGSGCGRDALAFAAAGRAVIGLERSQRAVNRAQARIASDAPGAVEFRCADVGDAGAIDAAVASLRGEAKVPVLFYARFLFHAIDEDAHRNLLAALARLAVPGDVVAAEFRAPADATLAKNSDKMVRRFVEPTDFRAELAAAGFEMAEAAVGTGLSPYLKEDPVLYRILARRG